MRAAPWALGRRGTWCRHLCLLAIAAHLCDPADATEPAKHPTGEAAGAVWRTVSESQLDKMRGGFDIGSGLMVSFGITRAVYINGALTTETSLNLGQLDQLTPAQAAHIGSQLGTVNLVQNGPGNTVQGGFTLQGPGTIVQNTLNNQNINVQTMINASSNGLGIIKGINTTRTITDALAGAVGAR